MRPRGGAWPSGTVTAGPVGMPVVEPTRSARGAASDAPPPQAAASRAPSAKHGRERDERRRAARHWRTVPPSVSASATPVSSSLPKTGPSAVVRTTPLRSMKNVAGSPRTP